MEFAVAHKKISSFNVAVRTSFFGGAKLLVDGNEIKGKKNVFELGNGAVITLKQGFLDPVPLVYVSGDTVVLAPKLNGFEYGWAAFPFLLTFVGGILGALIGVLATYLNFRVLRNTSNNALKYFLVFIVNCMAALLYLIVIVITQKLFKVPPLK